MTEVDRIFDESEKLAPSSATGSLLRVLHVPGRARRDRVFLATVFAGFALVLWLTQTLVLVGENRLPWISVSLHRLDPIGEWFGNLMNAHPLVAIPLVFGSMLVVAIGAWLAYGWLLAPRTVLFDVWPHGVALASSVHGGRPTGRVYAWRDVEGYSDRSERWVFLATRGRFGRRWVRVPRLSEDERVSLLRILEEKGVRRIA